MNSDEIFEKNVAGLLRHGALPLDAERSARAKRRFLRPERGSRSLAAAAAALLVASTILWSAWRGPEPQAVSKPPLDPVEFPGSGGDDLLRTKLVLPRDAGRDARLRLIGWAAFPDRLEFQIRTIRLEERLESGRLQPSVAENPSGTALLQAGRFEYEFPHRKPGVLKLEVTAKDAYQDTAVLKQLKVRESEREWTFNHRVWDDQLLSRVGPQLLEASALAAEVRELLGRVEASVASEPGFARQKKALIAEASRLATRGESFAKVGLYPASARASAQTASDLATSIEIFAFESGKFAGPRSYYTEGKRGRDHRNATFEFATLRGYLDEAVVIAGREFGLWIVEEFGRAGARPELADAVKPHRAHPGVAPFGERLLALDGVDLARLSGELRAVSK
jgi:hypothetical protein